ncbi:(2Fe-2S)-binding protein [Paenibacillus bovis]|uniref:Ferric siderophore reductase C-terminal domain-containing protein n=1 Tax=Paenibacillus bovis TaxID=1616788 RepID=A0A172ZH05_9BACL|nr:(2Fe-2S)-binding protein [Paenibacillus bovis]ANF96921.1 hypothetical protein AR543_13495 [Paenibacillus bovis]
MNTIPDWERLGRQFYITNEPHPSAIYRQSFTELFTRAGMQQLLQYYAPLLKAEDLQPAATFLCSWLTGIPLAVQYHLSVEQQGLTLDPAQMTLEMYMSGPYCQFAFHVNELSVEQLPVPAADDQHHKARDHYLHTVYRNILRPMIQQMTEVCGDHARMYWRQMPARFQYYTNQWKNWIDDDQIVQTIERDLHYVINGIPAEIFGLSRNPLNVPPRHTLNIDGTGETILRSACCLFHRMEDGEYCFNCPKISEAVREERRLAYQSREEKT